MNERHLRAADRRAGSVLYSSANVPVTDWAATTVTDRTTVNRIAIISDEIAVWRFEILIWILFISLQETKFYETLDLDHLEVVDSNVKQETTTRRRSRVAASARAFLMDVSGGSGRAEARPFVYLSAKTACSMR